MTAPNGPDTRVVAAWNAAADKCSDPALSFCDHFGARIVEHLSLKPGERVLDVCCGAGAVALPAAKAVGRHGRVIGVDAAERLLEIASRRASQAHVTNIEWYQADLMALPFSAASFDVVVCGFGIFYAPDKIEATRRLWELVRSGGTLLVASWRAGLFEPANSAFWDAVRKVRPSLFEASNPWDEIDTPEAIADLLANAGIPGGSVLEEPYEHVLVNAGDWWSVVLGSHYRAVVEQLGPLERDLVELLTMRPISDRRTINAHALFAIARRPQR